MTPTPAGRTVEFEGKTHLFPADATDDEIRQALGGAPPIPGTERLGGSPPPAAKPPNAILKDAQTAESTNSGGIPHHAGFGSPEANAGIAALSMLPAAAAAPVATGVGLAAGYGAQRGAKALGLPEPVPTLAGLAGGLLGGHVPLPAALERLAPMLMRGMGSAAAAEGSAAPSFIERLFGRLPEPRAQRISLPEQFGAEATPREAPEFSSIPAAGRGLPSGRMVGTGEPTPAPAPVVRPPLWRGLTDVPESPVQTPPPSNSGTPRLPSGRIPGGSPRENVVQPAIQKPSAAPIANPTSVRGLPSQAKTIAEQLADEMERSGTAPAAPKQPVATKEAYAGGARIKRADSAGSLADAFKEAKIPASDLDNMSDADWQAVAQRQGHDWPKTKLAQQKLIRDTKAAMEAK